MLKPSYFGLKLTSEHAFRPTHSQHKQAGGPIPNHTGNRTTFQIDLVRSAGGWIVRKEVPDISVIIERLKQKLAGRHSERLTAIAGIIDSDILPLILTREAAILNLLEEKLPAEYRRRVPRVLAVHTDGRGLVRQCDMTFLDSNSGPRLSHLEFARQAAELLHAIHHHAGVLHMDIEPENVLITRHGVSLVDFDSATREHRPQPACSRLNRTFQLVRRNGRLTRLISHQLEAGKLGPNWYNHLKPAAPSRGADMFRLALLINMPQFGSALRTRVYHYPESPDTQALDRLTAAILRPKQPERTDCKTAADLLRGITRIEQTLTRLAA